MGGNAQARVVATQFPQAFGLAQSWDPEALRIVGDTMGVESRVYNARWSDPNQCCTGIVIRAPVIDLGRDPRWGRTEESYGEDPYLVVSWRRDSSPAFTADEQYGGLQNTDAPYLMAASTLKHFLAYNNEANRNKSDSAIDDRNLLEYYLAPFSEVIKAGKGDRIMTSYNKISGESGDDLAAGEEPAGLAVAVRRHGVDRRVRAERPHASSGHNYMAMGWSYEKSAAEVIKSGQLLCGGNVTGNKPDDVEALRRAYTMNLVTVADLDFALRGSAAPSVPPRGPRSQELRALPQPDRERDSLDHRRIQGARARRHAQDGRAAQERANTLPLDKAALKNVAVIGPRADQVIRDWYGGQAALRR